MATVAQLKCSHRGCRLPLQLLARGRDGETTWRCMNLHERTYTGLYIARFVLDPEFPKISFPSECPVCHRPLAEGPAAIAEALRLGRVSCGYCQQVLVLNPRTGFWDEADG